MCVNMDEVGCAGRLLRCAGHAPLAVSTRLVVQEVDATSNLGHVPLHHPRCVSVRADGQLFFVFSFLRAVTAI